MPESLSSGRPHLAIPGPSIMPDRVLRAMHAAAPNIYEGELMELTETIFRDLNVVAENTGRAFIYIGNGHATWEASLVNTLSRDDKILALVTGRFGHGWVSTAKALGIDVQVLDFGMQSAADPLRVRAALEADTGKSIKAVITVQTDTATSVCNDIPAIRQAINEADHPALLMVDCIASFACEPFKMDEWGVDVMLTASQKGLMTPPGLGIVYIRDTVWQLHEQATLNTPYWNWKARAYPAYYAEQFCGTAPTHHLFGLREALNMLLEEGMPNVWHRHKVQAQAVWAAVDVWSNSNMLQLNVPLKKQRSFAVTAIKTAKGFAPRLRQWCEQEAGLTLGVGFNLEEINQPTADAFRIGHMGYQNPHMLLGTLSCIEAGLVSMDVKDAVGGVEAATRVIAEACATGDPA